MNLRRERGWTQRELAERVGWAHSRIAEIENGRVNPGIDKVEALAGALGVTVSDLVGDRVEDPRVHELERENDRLREQVARSAGISLELLQMLRSRSEHMHPSDWERMMDVTAAVLGIKHRELRKAPGD